jgi:hypothetical protein
MVKLYKSRYFTGRSLPCTAVFFGGATFHGIKQPTLVFEPFE